MKYSNHSLKARAPNKSFSDGLDPGRISRSIEIAEEAAFHLDIISSFENRGWALYEFGNGHPLTNSLDLQHVVEMGREKNKLALGIKYILLPLNEEDANWMVIRDLFSIITAQGRGPYFIDIEEVEDKESGDHWAEPIGVYLVDSVVLEPPFLRLIIDPRMSKIKDPSRVNNLKNCEIPLHVTCTHILRRQIMKALREV